ncbi:hypothetical protein ACG9Y7_06395 [Acinetobacter gerneri]|uniref:hypothetical protein n=1 Tax=Acinetobacter gerneri TaxID=202952 RepID=UPI003AF8E179
MAVIIECISVVIRNKSIIEKYEGGNKSFSETLQGKIWVSDGEVVCVRFMTPIDAKAYVDILEEKGLIFKDGNGKAIDIAVVDQIEGLLSDCDWIIAGRIDWNNDRNKKVMICCLNPSDLDEISVPKGWQYETSLTSTTKFIDGNNIPKNLKFVRNENGVDIWIDRATDQEYFVRR